MIEYNVTRYTRSLISCYGAVRTSQTAGFILLQAYKKLSLFMTILAKKMMTFL